MSQLTMNTLTKLTVALGALFTMAGTETPPVAKRLSVVATTPDLAALVKRNGRNG